jgi:hypothetical protein
MLLGGFLSLFKPPCRAKEMMGCERGDYLPAYSLAHMNHSWQADDRYRAAETTLRSLHLRGKEAVCFRRELSIVKAKAGMAIAWMRDAFSLIAPRYRYLPLSTFLHPSQARMK